jgi:hypothetical protein
MFPQLIHPEAYSGCFACCGLCRTNRERDLWRDFSVAAERHDQTARRLPGQRPASPYFPYLHLVDRVQGEPVRPMPLALFWGFFPESRKA